MTKCRGADLIVGMGFRDAAAAANPLARLSLCCSAETLDDDAEHPSGERVDTANLHPFCLPTPRRVVLVVQKKMPIISERLRVEEAECRPLGVLTSKP